MTEDDLFCHVFNGCLVEVQQTHSGVLHDGRLGVNTNGKRRWNVNADVLLRESVLEVDVDGHRLQVEESVVLDQRPDDFSAAVITFCGSGALGITVNDENFVGGCKFVAAGSDVNSCKDRNYEQANADENQCIHHG